MNCQERLLSFRDMESRHQSHMKRGTILLLNIGICYNKKDFEYDVYSLVRAFYPQSQVTTYYVDEEHTGEYPLLFLVTYEDDHIELEI